MNDCIPFFRPGADLTGTPTAAVVGKRFVALSGNKQTDGTYSIAPAAAGGRVLGVAAWDGAIGSKVSVISGSGFIVPVTADGAIAAGAEVEVGTAGKAATKGTGVAVGVCMTAVADGADAEIQLY